MEVCHDTDMVRKYISNRLDKGTCRGEYTTITTTRCTTDHVSVTTPSWNVGHDFVLCSLSSIIWRSTILPVRLCMYNPFVYACMYILFSVLEHWKVQF